MARERVMTRPRSMQSLVDDYLDERRCLGFALQISGTQLVAFARFVDQSGHSGPLTTRVIFSWVQGQATRATPITWARRLETIRPFTKYCRQIDPNTEVPSGDVFGPGHRRLTPHIYTEREIADLLTAAGQMAPQGSLRPATYQTLFGLIAATGMRLSEALNLRRVDVDLARSIVTIRRTKFAKSRLLPLHSTVTEALSRYIARRHQDMSTSPDAWFFLSSSGGRLPKRTVNGTFARLRAQLGWTARGQHLEPRIHDLRHSFICRRVMLWHDQGADIDHAMMALATYVGHVKVSDTYWYLTGVPDLMSVAGRRFEQFAFGSGEAGHG